VASKVLEKLIYVVRVTFVVGNNCLFSSGQIV
jgi:hypothetical protein